MIKSTLFQVHKLNEKGMERANEIAIAYDNFLEKLQEITSLENREGSIVKTKLEEACFFTKKSMATEEENHD